MGLGTDHPDRPRWAVAGGHPGATAGLGMPIAVLWRRNTTTKLDCILDFSSWLAKQGMEDRRLELSVVAEVPKLDTRA